MNVWLELLVTLTISGSILVVCNLLLRLVSPNIFSAKWQYIFGKTALIFYLLPVAFVLHWSLFSPEQSPAANLPQPGQWSEVVSEWIISAEFIPRQMIPAEFALMILGIWALGALVYVAWHIYCYIRFIRQMQKTSIPVPLESEAAKQLASIKTALGIRCKVRLAYNYDIESPVLIGLLKPTILIPRGHQMGMDLGMVFHHELIHLKRKDLWVKLLILGVSSIHWFNPLVHILRKDIHIWSELSCDEEVVRNMSHAERKRYGETILNVLEASSEMPVTFSASLSGNGKQLKRRLTILFNVRKLKKRTVILAVTTIIAIGAIGTSTAVWASNHIPQVKVKTEQNNWLYSLQTHTVQDEVNVKGGVKPINKNDVEHIEYVKKADPDQLKKLSAADTRENRLIAVRPSDEKRFTPEEWQDILAQIERGEMYWEDSDEFEEIKSKVMSGELTWAEALGTKAE